MKIAQSIPLYSSLPPDQKTNYRDENDYLNQKLPTDIAATQDYFDRSQYRRTQTMIEAPFRINTAAMVGFSAATAGLGIGRLFDIGLVMAAPCGAMETYEGVKHKDRRLIVDGAFNMAIGASSMVAAFAPLGLATLAPVALVGARELYLLSEKLRK